MVGNSVGIIRLVTTELSTRSQYSCKRWLSEAVERCGTAREILKLYVQVRRVDSNTAIRLVRTR